MKTIVCWKCLEEGHLVGMPLFKVKNSFVFACNKHKDLEVPDTAYSLKEGHSLKGEHEDTNHHTVAKR